MDDEVVDVTQKERVIPVEILSLPRHDARSASDDFVNGTDTTDNNANDLVKGLPVTFSDGSSSQTERLITQLSDSETIKLEILDNGTSPHERSLEIEEIGELTFERERDKRTKNEKKVRRVPIKLRDRKVVQVFPDETTQFRREFIDVCHQEYPDAVTAKGRKASRLSDRKMTKGLVSAKVTKERVIPIVLEDTGETIRPDFTRLEDPQPTNWGLFDVTTKSHSTNESEVPIRLKDVATFDGGSMKVACDGDCENHVSTPSPSLKNTKDHKTKAFSLDARAKVSHSPFPTLDSKSSLAKTTETSGKKPTEKRSQTVRFNIDGDEKLSKGKKGIFVSENEHRWPSPSQSPTGLPPSGPSSTSRFQSKEDARERKRTQSGGASCEPAFTESSSVRRSPNSRDEQEALQEIDRDITRIWKDLKELEPQGSNSDKSPPQYETVKIRQFSIPEPSSSQLLTSGDKNQEKRTIWDMDSSRQSEFGSGAPNGKTLTEARQSDFQKQHSGIVRPGWSVPATSVRDGCTTDGTPAADEPDISISKAVDGKLSFSERTLEVTPTWVTLGLECSERSESKLDKSTQTLESNSGRKSRNCVLL